MNPRKLFWATLYVAVVCAGAGAGAVLLGIVAPVILFFIAAFVLGDMGGPLFWPFLMILGLIIGAASGFVLSLLGCLLFWLLRRSARHRRALRTPVYDVQQTRRMRIANTPQPQR